MPRAWCGENGVPHLGITRAKNVVDLVSTERTKARFALTVDVVRVEGELDVRGPYVNGRRRDRFVYLNWGHADGDAWGGNVARVKLSLSKIDTALMAAATAEGAVLVAELDLSNDKGAPVAATVHPPRLQWRVE